MDLNKNESIRYIKTRIGKLIVASTFCLCLGISLWFTPLPNAPEVSCDRPCHELEWPRICRLQFSLESYRWSKRSCPVEGHDCNDGNNTSQFFENEEFFVVNREITTPTIHVCTHDILLINVANRINNKAISIHWRGQTLNGQPLMDGVSMISQCPINSFTTFQYKFRASDIGTHSWYLHTGKGESLNNNYIHGLLIVRQSTHQDPHWSLIDYDSSEHRILLRTISKKNETVILINGKYSPDTMKYKVIQGKSFRFRIAHFGGSVKCAIKGMIEKHTLVVITLDGNPVEAVNTTSFTIVEGERLDFIVIANQITGIYNMKFQFVNCPIKSKSVAKLIYSENTDEKKYISTVKTPNRQELPLSKPFSTQMTEDCGKSMICLEDLASTVTKPSTSLERIVEKVYFLTYGYKELKINHIVGTFRIPQINNFTFLYPTSPLNSQIEDISTTNWCKHDEGSGPAFCSNTEICYCTHVIEVNFGTIIDVVLVHEEEQPGREHIFHLHGHKFHVLGRQINEKKLSVKTGHNLLYNDKMVIKDTISVPCNGSAVFRFLANNVGYWLLEEEEEGSQGMQVVFHVSGETFNVPEKFPKCGDWIGPKYFMT